MTSREEWAAQQHETLEQLHGNITEAIEALVTGEDWAKMLEVSAQFHRYSFNNQLLIAYQTGGKARLPASFTTWKQLGRYVKKGEKGIKILAPVNRTLYIDKDTGDVVTKQEARGRPKGSVERVSKMVGVKVVHVFDVSQTDGEPLPSIERPQLLDGQAPDGLRESLESIIADAGFTLAYVPAGTLNGANGVTRFLAQRIEIRNDVTDAQTVKTLIHEIAHMKMHARIADPTAAALHRGKAEVEAESTAYLVASAHGLDTSGYTFPYVAGWSGGDIDLVKSTASDVVAQAQAILAVTQPQELSIDAMVELRHNGEALRDRAQTRSTRRPQTRGDVAAAITARARTATNSTETPVRSRTPRR